MAWKSVRSVATVTRQNSSNLKSLYAHICTRTINTRKSCYAYDCGLRNTCSCTTQLTVRCAALLRVLEFSK
eukprot:6182790-Pleurochrysis_carterae.AAC.1